MAFESLIIGAALVILVIQIATLINLLQNEVKPILKATTDTVNTLRGTTEFLSENLVEPVIKLNSYLAGLRKFFNLFGMNKK
jgi:amino acid permease